MKKIFGTMFAVLVLIIIVSDHLVKNDLNKLHLKFLDRIDENKEVYVNGKKIDSPNEIIDGLKHTQAFRFAKNGKFPRPQAPQSMREHLKYKTIPLWSFTTNLKVKSFMYPPKMFT